MAAERNTFSSIRDKDRRTKAGSTSHAERPCDLTRLPRTPRGASRAGLCLGHASGLLALQPSPFRGPNPTQLSGEDTSPGGRPLPAKCSRHLERVTLPVPFHDGSFLLLWFTFKHPQLSPQQNVFNTRRMIRPILQPNRFSVSSIRLALTFNLPHPTSVAAGHSTVDWIRVRHQEFQGQAPGTSSPRSATFASTSRGRRGRGQPPRPARPPARPPPAFACFSA